ncbi:MAG: serine hydrolase domain-containing protein [Pseudomonadota bacterium]
MLKILSYGAAGLIALLAVIWWAIGPDYRAALRDMPEGNDVFAFTLNQRDIAFRLLDAAPWIMRSRDIDAGGAVKPLPQGEPLQIDLDVDAYFEKQRAAALIIIHDGRIRYERYGLDFRPNKRWTSFSVGKSLTSTLAGAALQDGYIESLDDPVTKYVPEFIGTAYDGPTVEDILKMTSGVDWDEDYGDPDSDVRSLNDHVPEEGVPQLISYLSTLGRRSEPGEQFYYNSSETGLIGLIVSRAVERPLADYLSETIWRPYGMQQKATWMIDPDGVELAGCCIQATPRDFARFGLFVLEEMTGIPSGEIPEGWFETAGAQLIEDTGEPGWGYGYQWWTFEDGSFTADGVFGQAIFVDPNRNLVIASNSSWTSPVGRVDGEFEERDEFWAAVKTAIDNETGLTR